MTRVTITGRSESDTDMAAILRGYVDRFELTSPMVKNIMLDAAAEIERLRAALREIITLKAEDMPHAIENSQAAAIARAALEPKP